MEATASGGLLVTSTRTMAGTWGDPGLMKRPSALSRVRHQQLNYYFGMKSIQLHLLGYGSQANPLCGLCLSFILVALRCLGYQSMSAKSCQHKGLRPQNVRCRRSGAKHPEPSFVCTHGHCVCGAQYGYSVPWQKEQLDRSVQTGMLIAAPPSQFLRIPLETCHIMDTSRLMTDVYPTTISSARLTKLARFLLCLLSLRSLSPDHHRTI